MYHCVSKSFFIFPCNNLFLVLVYGNPQEIVRVRNRRVCVDAVDNNF